MTVVLQLFFAAPSERALAQHVITWDIDQTVLAPYDQYLDDLMAILYPAIVQFYGEPCDTHTILVRYEVGLVGGYYDPLSDHLAIGWLPNSGTGATTPDPKFDYFMAHELTHAFRAYCHWIPSWMEEGSTEACNALLVRYLAEQQLRILDDGVGAGKRVFWYDTFANLGDAVLGGSDWSRGFADWVSGPESYSAVFFLTILSQVQGAIWSWENYGWLAALNSRIYTLPTGMVSAEQVTEIIGQVTSGTMDGRPVGEWFTDQPIASTPDREGRFLAVYPTYDGSAPVNPHAVTYFAFEWGPDPQYPHIMSQLRIETGASVDIDVSDVYGTEVFSGTGALYTAEPNYPNGNHLALPDTTTWARGAYQIHASVDLGTEALIATNTFIAGDSQLAELPGHLGIISVNSAGHLVDARWESSDCTMLYQERGAAVLDHEDKTALPAQCQLTNVDDPDLSYSLSVPLPFTRVITVEGVETEGDASVPDADYDSDIVVPDSGPPGPDPTDGCSCRTDPGAGLAGPFMVILLWLAFMWLKRRPSSWS